MTPPSRKNHSLVWDLPLRVFHWGLVIGLAVSVYTGQFGDFDAMDIHFISGYTVLGLVVFRLLWGIVGSRPARFASFVVGPRRVLAYCRSLLNPNEPQIPGHNPLGALSIVALLAVVLFQTGTGLFASDDILFEGPLTHWVSDDTSGSLTSLHKQNKWVLAGLVTLHLLAIACYTLVKRHTLIRPMLHGRLDTETTHESVKTPWVAAIVCALLSAGSVYGLVNWL